MSTTKKITIRAAIMLLAAVMCLSAGISLMRFGFADDEPTGSERNFSDSLVARYDMNWQNGQTAISPAAGYASKELRLSGTAAEDAGKAGGGIKFGAESFLYTTSGIGLDAAATGATISTWFGGPIGNDWNGFMRFEAGAPVTIFNLPILMTYGFDTALPGDFAEPGFAWDTLVRKAGNFFHLAITIDPTGIKYYVDGVLAYDYSIAKATEKGLTAIVTSINTSINTVLTAMKSGTVRVRGFNAAPDGPADVVLDEFRVYEGAFDADDIANLHFGYTDGALKSFTYGDDTITTDDYLVDHTMFLSVGEEYAAMSAIAGEDVTVSAISAPENAESGAKTVIKVSKGNLHYYYNLMFERLLLEPTAILVDGAAIPNYKASVKEYTVNLPATTAVSPVISATYLEGSTGQESITDNRTDGFNGEVIIKIVDSEGIYDEVEYTLNFVRASSAVIKQVRYQGDDIFAFNKSFTTTTWTLPRAFAANVLDKDDFDAVLEYSDTLTDVTFNVTGTLSGGDLTVTAEVTDKIVSGTKLYTIHVNKLSDANLVSRYKLDALNEDGKFEDSINSERTSGVWGGGIEGKALSVDNTGENKSVLSIGMTDIFPHIEDGVTFSFWTKFEAGNNGEWTTIFDLDKTTFRVDAPAVMRRNQPAWLTDGKEMLASFGDNTWKNMVITITNSGAVVYIDGEAKDTYLTDTANGAITNWKIMLDRIRTATRVQFFKGVLASEYFSGLIRDFRVYDVALAREDVVTLYEGNYLSDIKVGGTSIKNFLKTKYDYTYTYDKVITSVPTVTYTLSDTGADAAVTGGVATVDSLNNSVYKITVNEFITYTITFKKGTMVNTLSDIKYDGVTITGFNAETLTYTIKVNKDKDGNPVFKDVTYTPSDTDSSVSYTGPTAAKPRATILVRATAENASNRTYTIEFEVQEGTATGKCGKKEAASILVSLFIMAAVIVGKKAIG